MWWNQSINKRVKYINNNYHQQIKNVCSKVLWSYPPVPLEIEDLYNVVLFKIATSIIDYDKKIEIEIFILSKAKGYAKNTCRKYLTYKHKILNNFVPLTDDKFTISDSITFHDQIDIDHWTFIEKKVFTSLYLKGETRKKLISKSSLSRREIERIDRTIKKKVKKQLYIV